MIYDLLRRLNLLLTAAYQELADITREANGPEKLTDDLKGTFDVMWSDLDRIAEDACTARVLNKDGMPSDASEEVP